MLMLGKEGTFEYEKRLSFLNNLVLRAKIQVQLAPLSRDRIGKAIERIQLLVCFKKLVLLL